MFNAIVLAICGFFAAAGAIELFAETESLTLSLAITLATYAFVLSCFARLTGHAHSTRHPGQRLR
jgi:Co/Zn/Cd efflux system component